jgi:CO/xanthine dehydrogenase FAD-binding subunit
MPFIVQPHTAREAQSLKDALGASAAFIGGGTALQLAWGDETPELILIDVAGLPEVQGIVLTGTRLRIGAGIRLESLRRDPFVLAHAPLLAAACDSLAALSVRHLATLGGNVGWRCGDTLAVLLVLDALAELADGSTIPLATWLTVNTSPLLVAVHIVADVASPLAFFEKVGHRAAFSPTRLALAMHALRVDSKLVTVRVAASAAGLPARRLHRVEQALEGLSLTQLERASTATACAQDISDPALARLACRLLHGHLAALV